MTQRRPTITAARYVGPQAASPTTTGGAAFVLDDGGRKAAGFKGTVGDCVCRAVAIATSKPYAEIHAALGDVGWAEKRMIKDVDGLYRPRSDTKDSLRWFMEQIGWRWVPTMSIGKGCTVHLRADELPSGRIIARVSRHWVAVIDGVIHDLYDCSRDGTRCVYGYFTQDNDAD